MARDRYLAEYLAQPNLGIRLQGEFSLLPGTRKHRRVMHSGASVCMCVDVCVVKNTEVWILHFKKRHKTWCTPSLLNNYYPCAVCGRVMCFGYTAVCRGVGHGQDVT